MTAEAIKEHLEAVPFVPFTIHIPDRPPMRVPHPDFAHIAPSQKSLAVWNDKTGEGPRILDIRLITEIQPEQEQKSEERQS
jgi:hypothetical protein